MTTERLLSYRKAATLITGGTINTVTPESGTAASVAGATQVKADNVYCDTTGTYLFEATVTAGAVTGTGSVSLAVVADVKAKPQISISPNVDTSSVDSYTITLEGTLE